jgi:hypothetical protein
VEVLGDLQARRILPGKGKIHADLLLHVAVHRRPKVIDQEGCCFTEPCLWIVSEWPTNQEAAREPSALSTPVSFRQPGRNFLNSGVRRRRRLPTPGRPKTRHRHDCAVDEFPVRVTGYPEVILPVGFVRRLRAVARSGPEVRFWEVISSLQIDPRLDSPNY